MVVFTTTEGETKLSEVFIILSAFMIWLVRRWLITLERTTPRSEQPILPGGGFAGCC